MPSEYLAQELIDVIIDGISEQIDSQKTLLQCARVSHAFLPRCRMHLFRVVELETYSYLPSSVCDKFLQILEAQSGLAQYVRSIILKNVTAEKALPRIIELLPSLEEIKVHAVKGASWSTFQAPLQQSLSAFLETSATKLTLKWVDHVPVSLLARSQSLTFLSLRNAVLAQDTPVDEESPTSLRLQSIHLRASFPLPPVLLRPQQNAFSTLKSLSVTVLDFEFGYVWEIMELASSTLETLILHYSNCRDPIPVQNMINLENFYDLKHLTLSCKISLRFNKYGLPFDILALLKSAPVHSSIEKIHISVQWNDCDVSVRAGLTPASGPWYDLDNTLTGERYPQLKAFTFCLSLVYDDPGSDEEVPGDQRSLDRAHGLFCDKFRTMLPDLSNKASVLTRLIPS